MTMFDAPSDRDYQEYLHGSNPYDAYESEPEETEDAKRSWVYGKHYSIDYLKLPKVEKVSLKPADSEECPF